MRDTWFISDTHFGHEAQAQMRGFYGVEAMDEHMIERWNAKVKPEDLVYHLGDFAWTISAARRVRPRLNGTIRLALGNHDSGIKLAKEGFFQRISLWFLFSEEGFTASHLPMPKSQLRHSDISVHGHTHDRPGGEPHQFCVCVEQQGFAPMHREDLTYRIKALRRERAA